MSFDSPMMGELAKQKLREYVADAESQRYIQVPEHHGKKKIFFFSLVFQMFESIWPRHG